MWAYHSTTLPSCFTQIINGLEAQSDLPKVRPIFISLDPNRDTVEQMDKYVSGTHVPTHELGSFEPPNPSAAQTSTQGCWP